MEIKIQKEKHKRNNKGKKQRQITKIIYTEGKTEKKIERNRGGQKEVRNDMRRERKKLELERAISKGFLFS